MEYGYYNFLDRNYCMKSEDGQLSNVVHHNNLIIKNATNYEKVIIADTVKELILDVVDIYRADPYLALFSYKHIIDNLNSIDDVLYYIDCDIENNLNENCYIFYQPDDDEDEFNIYETVKIELKNNNKELIINYLDYFRIKNVNISKIFNIIENFNYVEALLTLEFLRLNNFKQLDLKPDIKYIIETFIQYIAENEKISIDEVKRRLLLNTKKIFNLHIDIDEIFKKYFKMFVRYEDNKYIINSDLNNLLNNNIQYKDIDALSYQYNREIFEKLSIHELIYNHEVLVEMLLQIKNLKNNNPNINVTEYYKKDILNLKFLIPLIFHMANYGRMDRPYDLKKLLVKNYFSEIDVGRATRRNIYAKYKKFISESNEISFLYIKYFENKEDFINELFDLMNIEDITLLPQKDQELINRIKDEK